MQKISISQINFNQATQDQMDEPQLDEEVVIEKKMNIAMQNHIINDESTQQDPHLTAAYIDFKERLSYKYMITVDTSDFKVMKRKMGMISGNTSPCFYLMTSCLPCYWCGPVFQVPNNQFALVIYRFSTGKKTLIYGPGFHTLYCYSSLQGVYSFSEEYQNNLIESENGDLKIIKVSQGSIAHFECSGQNIILPPGIHLIRDPLIFIENISLDSFFITIGPQRWVTVPDGYDGISIDRGKIKILRGGKQHHLNHAGDKFAKLIPKILQTDKVPSNITQYLVQLENSRFNKDQLSKQNSSDPTFNLMAKTIEGATVFVDAMIFWSIVDTEIAAKTAMEILDNQEQYHTNNQEKAIQDAYYNVQNLRKTVLRIAKNHLCSTISTYSLSSKSEKEHSNLKIDDYNADVKNTFEILQVLQQQDNILKQNINKGKYIKSDLMDVGCYMKAICIYSVRPLEEIQTEIDKQTKTKVDAKTNIIRMQNQQQIQMIDTQTQNEIMIQKAQVDADVILTGANAKAEAKIIKAQCLAEVITTISTARFNEAKELTTTNVAQDLEKIRVIGDAGEKIFTGANNQFVFGQNPGDSIFSLLKGIKK